METWIVRMVRARRLRQVVAWALAAGCITIFGISERRYVTNFLFGPFDLGPSELDSILDVSETPHYFARVAGSKAINTGLQQITIRKEGGVERSRSVSASYYILVVGERLLVVKSGADALITVEGELLATPLDLDRLLFNTPDVQALRNRFYPFYVSDEAFRLPGYIGIVAVLVFGFFFVKLGLPAWRYLQQPLSHPVVKRVISWGDHITIAAEAEREARSPRYKGRNRYKGRKRWAITDNYLLQSSFFTFDLVRFADLLWAYKRVTKHSIYFIPTGKTYDAVLTCYGGSAVLEAREKILDAVLMFATQRAPWAVFAFSKELEDLFNKNSRDFCAAVEQRKREWEQQKRA